MGLHMYVPAESSETAEESETFSSVPLDIGVEVLGGKMEVIIPRQSSVPITASKIFSTTADNQQEIELKYSIPVHLC